jgi:thiol-disulfide isomerase/thioredoxin
MLLYIILGLLFVVSIYLLYVYYQKKQKIQTEFVENNEYKEMNETNHGDIYIFHVDWCPHSKKTLDKLKPIQEKYKHLTFHEIDCEKNVDMADAYNVVSYPTIVLLYKNEKYYYDAELDDNTFDTFITTIMK